MKKLFCIIFLFCIFSLKGYCTIKNVHKERIKISSHKITNKEFIEFKNRIGTYQEDKNYNILIDGHGTGLAPPTEKEWKLMKDKIKIIDDIILLKQTDLPDSIDWTSSKYFPPIGDQGAQGSCSAWPTAYYGKTFQEAWEHDWDLSEAVWDANIEGPSLAYQDKIVSPSFIFNQINEGTESGFSWIALLTICNLGVCTWTNMPYREDDYLSWPSEKAYREAPLWRSKEAYQLDPQSENAVINVKKLLTEGNFLCVSIDGRYIQEMTTLDNYPTQRASHACTIVGYNDKKSYLEEGMTRQGAFKIANSWGPDWADDGCFWISYAILSKLLSLYGSFDKVDYHPNLTAVFQVSHGARNQCYFSFEYKARSKNMQKYFLIRTFTRTIPGNPFPENRIVLDMTEFNFSDLDSIEYFACRVTDTKGSATGDITHFSVEVYDDYSFPPVNHLKSEETPCPTRGLEADGFGNACYIYPIQIVKPNGGEVLSASDAFVIEWQSLNVEKVLLQYTTNLTDWHDLATVPGEDLQYEWLVPNVSSGIAKIRASDLADSTVYDKSNAYFTITGDASVTLITPDRGDTLMMGQQCRIEWERLNYDGGINIYLYKDGMCIDTLATDVSGDAYDWNPLYLSSGNDYQIRITGTGKYPIDMSEGEFTILSPVNITSPNGDEQWINGSVQNIIWSTTENKGTVNLYLYEDEILIDEIAVALSDTNFSWTVPMDLEYSDNYKIGVITADGAFADHSDQGFTITEAKVKWKYFTDEAFIAPLAIDEHNQIYTGSSYILNAFSDAGDRLWQIDHTCGIDSPPVIDGNGIIYIGAKRFGGENLIAAFPYGTEKWRIDGSWPTGGQELSHFSPAVSKDNKLYAVKHHNIYTIDEEGVKELFYSMLEGGGLVYPTIGYDQKIYCNNGISFYSINMDKSIHWQIESDNNTHAFDLVTIVIDLENNIYCINGRGIIFKFDYRGNIIWQFDTGFVETFARQGPIIGRNHILYATGDEYLYALTKDGQLLWKTRLFGRFHSPPTVGASNTIYVLSQADMYSPLQKLIAVNDDGSIRWEYLVCNAANTKGVAGGPESLSVPIIDENGVIYVGSRDGHLYAFETCYETGLADTPWPIWRRDTKNIGRQDYYLSLKYPDNNEQFNPGDDIVIKWEKSQIIKAVQIEYSIDNGEHWELITNSTTNDSTYKWQYSEFINDHQKCLIKISIPNRDAFFDMSEKGFWINSTSSNETYHLYQNYPNPFNSETTIEYYLYKDATIYFEIYNLLGERIIHWKNKNQTIGIHTVKWDGCDTNGKRVSSSIYICKIKSGNFQSSKKMVLIK